MGLLDQVVGAVAANVGNSAGAQNPLLGAVMQLLNNPQTGGLAGLVQSFQDGGLGEIVNSWVGSGGNLPISAQQIQQILGSGQLGGIASQLGVDHGTAASSLAQYLPRIIDHLTPNGSLPANNDLVAQGMDMLKGKLFG